MSTVRRMRWASTSALFVLVATLVGVAPVGAVPLSDDEVDAEVFMNVDASFGVTNYFLRSLGLISTDISWYTNESTALIAVIVPTLWKGYPFFTLTLLAAMQSIPGNLYEAAEVDGASAWQRFTNITWPGIRGQATLALVLNGLWVFREFDIIYAATGGGPSKTTETLGIRAYNEAFGYFYMGRAAVIGVLMLAIALAAVLLARKQLRKEFF